ncbi:MAG: 30S ribosomal protein S4 [Clostridia bacterium]|nr:30S ribosomal protein S4 [Clostridia bacterium]
MAVKDPILKRCRYLGISPMALGIDKKSNRNPGGNTKKRVSEYGIQLKEKQKVKFIYGVREKQFRKYYDKAQKSRNATGAEMLSLIERRLDNVVYRLGFGATRPQARQFVNHGLITVNGKVVDIPSYQVDVNDVVAIKDSKKDYEIFKSLKEVKVVCPKWLSVDMANLCGKVIAKPQRDDIDANINETLIVEFYSK